MHPERAKLLALLLRETREQDGGCFPDQAWFELHKSVGLPYVEIVVPRYSPQGQLEFFLSRRAPGDPHWPGEPWHIPGGFWRVNQTLGGACESVGRRELGASVVAVDEVMTFKWTDHPFGNPISHICVCKLSEDPCENPAARFWPASALPQPMLLHHADFLKLCQRFLHHARSQTAPTGPKEN